MRLVVYDRTCVKKRGHLSPVWAAGAHLYRALGRTHAAHGVASWDEALGWLAAQRQPIQEIQYWGHGKWGSAFVDQDVLDAESIANRHRGKLEAIRERLAPGARIWFRTCETFGARPGIDFAQRLADFLGVHVAGHTFIIGFHQSGLRTLAPGMRADWSADEGLARGTPDEPKRARWSRPWAPRTVTALTGEIPARWLPR